MPDYINPPAPPQDPVEISNNAFDEIKAAFPNFKPEEPQLATILIGALALRAAEVADLTSMIPRAIFRTFGATMVGLQPLDGSPALATLTFTARDSAGYTVLEGTLVAIEDINGDSHLFAITADAVIPAGQTSVPLVVAEAVDDGVAANNITTGVVTLVDDLDFILDVTQQGTTSGGTDAESDDAYLSRLTRRLGLIPRPVLAEDFARIVLVNFPEVWRMFALENVDPFINLLTANQASLETNTTGWAAGTNTAIAQGTPTTPPQGTKSLQLTATAGANISAVTPTGVSGIPVAPTVNYTAHASFRAATTGRSCSVQLDFYNQAGANVGTTVGTVAADVNTGWTLAYVRATAPATAAFVSVTVNVTAAANTEVHHVDAIMLRQTRPGEAGAPAGWTAGGTTGLNIERMITLAGIDANGNNITQTLKDAIAAFLLTQREWGFVVNVLDPVRTPVDATFAFTTRIGYNKADTETKAEQAVSDYVSARVWGAPPGDSQGWTIQATVPLWEVVTVINNVEGVERLTSLTLGKNGGTQASSDLSLPGAFPLATPGTIAGTAS